MPPEPGSDRRRARREPLDASIEFDGDSAQSRNLSVSGMFLETERDLFPQTPSRVTVVLPDTYPLPPVRLEAEGRIVRVERRGERLGVALAFDSVRFQTADGQDLGEDGAIPDAVAPEDAPGARS